MNFDLKTPCPRCPFRTDVQPFLRTARAQSICDDITHNDNSFPCHKTTAFDDDGEPVPSKNEQHCAGALILLEKIGMPNQIMRIAARQHWYKPKELRMDAPVYDTVDQMVEAYRKANGPDRRR